ncbi:MAG: hypothetical protein GY867_07365 [bacterium]|nr:hypothetical protein [bacterium]
MYIRISRPDGSVTDYGLEDLKEIRSESGSKFWTFIYQDIVKGAVIEEGMEFSGSVLGRRPPMDYDIPLQYRIPCEKLEVSFAYPSWWDIDIKRIGENDVVDFQYEDSLEAKKTILRYRAADIPAVRPERYAPSFKNVAPYLQFMVTDLSMGRRSPAHPGSWVEVAERYRDGLLSNSERTRIDPRLGKHLFRKEKIESMNDLVKAITRGVEPGLDQLDSITSYIRRNIEIGYETKEGNCRRMLKAGKGTIHDVTLMARNMFREAGFDADFILVHDESDGFFDIDYVSFDQLHRCAVRVRTEQADLVVFPYTEDVPLTYIPPMYLGQIAMVLRKDTAYSFWDVPDTTIARNVTNETYHVEISPVGNVTISEEKRLEGHFAFGTRAALRNLEGEELEDVLDEFITYSGTGGEIDFISHEIVNLEDYREPLLLKLKYSVGNLVTLAPGEVLFQTSGLFSPISYDKYRLELEERTNPIEVRAEELYAKKISISYPDSWIISNRPADVTFENEFGSVGTSFAAATGTLDAELTLKLLRTKQPKEKYPDFLELRGALDALQVSTIVFEVQEI